MRHKLDLEEKIKQELSLSPQDENRVRKTSVSSYGSQVESLPDSNEDERPPDTVAMVIPAVTMETQQKMMQASNGQTQGQVTPAPSIKVIEATPDREMTKGMPCHTPKQHIQAKNKSITRSKVALDLSPVRVYSQ